MAYDPVYSFRMPTAVRKALEEIARKEQRSLASLILKIISDFLEDRGAITSKDANGERRRYYRSKTLIPATWRIRGKEQTSVSVVKNFSTGGLYMESPKPAGPMEWSTGEWLPCVDLYLKHPMMTEPMRLPAKMKRVQVSAGKFGIALEFEDSSGTDHIFVKELFLSQS